DSRGSSRSHVTLTVTRIGSNLVRITSNYARLPIVDVSLTRAMDKIVQAQGDTVFLLDPMQRPARLDVSFLNEVSWAGTKQWHAPDPARWWVSDTCRLLEGWGSVPSPLVSTEEVCQGQYPGQLQPPAGKTSEP